MTQESLHLIQVYGYWLMAFGALIEGESFLLLGGVAASQGLLHLPGLILLALVGSTIHDHIFYLIGYFGGKPLLHRFKSWEEKSKKGLKLVDKYGVWLILSLRFLYGLRTIIPIVIGMSPVRYYKFLFFDFLGGILWSCFFVLGGYYFGIALEKIIREIEYYESWVWMGLVIGFFVLVIFGVLIYFIRRRIRNNYLNHSEPGK